MALRCIYTDLDGTLLGAGGSLFRDIDGNFSRIQARLLEACHRAEVEVVIMSGRRLEGVAAPARMMGQDSFIYEAGCGLVIGGEETVLTGDLEADGERTLVEQMHEGGVPELLFTHFGEELLEWHAPWHPERRYSLLMRGKADVVEANRVLEEAGHGNLRFLDNGAIGNLMPGLEVTHAYHVVPRGVTKGAAVEVHMRARGYAPEECIAAGDSIEDLTAAPYVGRFFCVANGPERDAGLKETIATQEHVTVTEGCCGEGVYEAVIGTLARQ